MTMNDFRRDSFQRLKLIRYFLMHFGVFFSVCEIAGWAVVFFSKLGVLVGWLVLDLSLHQEGAQGSVTAQTW